MELPSKLRFTLINNLNGNEVINSKYVIYAHKCNDGVYVGLTNDPVKRWQEHLSDAFNEGSRNYDDNFREAIRRCGRRFDHYIVAVAAFENAAKKIEAAAIQFYSDRLNMKNEAVDISNSYQFNPIGKQIGKMITLEKKSSGRQTYAREDSERQSVVAEIYEEYGRKRLRVIDGQPFRKGMNIRCDTKEREKFNIGDKVRIKVAVSKRGETEFLEAAKTSIPVLIE